MTSTFEPSATRSGFFLAVGKRQLRPLLDPRDGLVGIDRRPGRLSDGQRLELLGDFAFGSVKASKEDAAPVIEIVGDDRAILEAPGRAPSRRARPAPRADSRVRASELLDRQAAMPIVHRLGERIGDAGTYADQRGLLDAELGRDLIGGAEADAADVASQAIRVLRDEPNGIGAIGLVDAHRARRADAVAVQEQHDLADDLLLGPAGDDPLRALRADAGHLAQAVGLLLDDVEHGFAEGAHELLRIDRPDAADHAGAEIFLDALDRRRCRRLEERGSELDAMRAVVDPAAARLDELAGRDHRGMAEDGDQIALAAGFDPQHAEAVLGVVERDALDQAGQNLGWRARPWRLRHRAIMRISAPGRYRSETNDETSSIG